jgi:4-amino-4-deoxy-L-arabinose transferase-like glycosyltransferase
MPAMTRRCLLGIVLLSAALHGWGIARSVVPAQDGLKFLRVARELGRSPWSDVVRGSDQHPLYPFAIALVEPAASALLGRGPEAWRVAAQGVSAVASLLALLPLFAFARNVFDERTALLACLLFAVLPAFASIGHDTLSDALALSLFMTALWSVEVALRTHRFEAALLGGAAAGLGYWTRPELAVLPVVALGVASASAFRNGEATGFQVRRALPRVAALGVSFLALVGLYAVVKGEVSE